MFPSYTVSHLIDLSRDEDNGKSWSCRWLSYLVCGRPQFLMYAPAPAILSCVFVRVYTGVIKGGIDVTGRRVRRLRKLLNDLKERRGCSHPKEEALVALRGELALEEALYTCRGTLQNE
jgi:hypothetical protein